MADPIFADHRLAQLYDPLDPDRSDLAEYAAIVDEFGARSVVDIGCGTGVFACMLTQRGITVTGVDPAAASLEIAQHKPHAETVDWIRGDATDLPRIRVDMATMTANVAQVFLTDTALFATLRAAHRALKPGGHLVFETRDPRQRAWLGWNRAQTHSTVDVAGIGTVESWCEVVNVEAPFVTFCWTYEFHVDGTTLKSESTLRFRNRNEVEQALTKMGFAVEEVRDAPDRPGREFVFIASRQ